MPISTEDINDCIKYENKLNDILVKKYSATYPPLGMGSKGVKKITAYGATPKQAALRFLEKIKALNLKEIIMFPHPIITSLDNDKFVAFTRIKVK